ncbi:Two component system, signal transduction histidine kinase [Acididesulfobacillus acetoxydans]|uniref:histidine kinase n=1 Tax=Acididesulfobacillus acetoxydans TaxID=1561005 RepID=A0A8S0Y4C4_9FIRM|nr:ATP-binding protein [Acididesulfobacillus acetoxydans]CAA7602875.1 Two component system, signal transduction histidine kinase [Acididesulfobacillus acetoxydans]CEJ05756.1 Alkaline phosphatase synthesis sensor protein PhoR [Acididesulfobacillus acetoxydans]
MSLKWKLTGLFLVMTGLSLLLFRNGESVLKGYGFTVNPWMTFLALVLPGGLVLIYSYRLTEDVRTLQACAQRLSRGSFEQVPGLSSGAELGQLGEELNRLSRHIENLIQTAAQETHRLEALLGGMQEGVVALDHVGRVVLLNSAAEEIFSRPFAEVKHKYLVELVQDQELDRLVAEVLQGGAAALIELNIGEYIVRTQVSPILSEDGRARGAVIVCHDITELRRLEKLRTEFVANVSHELRTPLTSIKGFAETLLDGAAEEPALRERFLKIIQAESLRLQRLVEDLLTLSHIENRGVRRADGISNVQRAYEKIQPVIERYAEAKGISLNVAIPPDLPALSIGEDLLSQLMLNLLENAVKYTSGGSVWLKASTGVGEVRLEFGDTGCGIPEKSLPRIFERFFRVDKARSREQGGTGLGLSIVKHIVDGSGGKVTVQSELGKGTVFTCSLPMAL